MKQIEEPDLLKLVIEQAELKVRKRNLLKTTNARLQAIETDILNLIRPDLCEKAQLDLFPSPKEKS